MGKEARRGPGNAKLGLVLGRGATQMQMAGNL